MSETVTFYRPVNRHSDLIAENATIVVDFERGKFYFWNASPINQLMGEIKLALIKSWSQANKESPIESAL